MKTSKKILVVDDDIDIITTLKTILSKEGYKVLTANGKMEAKAIAKKEKPDLAILDVMMTTHYEGFELAKDFIEDSDFNTMKVMMQSSIDVLTTTKESIQDMAREYRKDIRYKELQVILFKNIISGDSGIDYRDENGKTICFPVDGFLRKPIDANYLLPAINKLIN